MLLTVERLQVVEEVRQKYIVSGNLKHQSGRVSRKVTAQE